MRTLRIAMVITLVNLILLSLTLREALSSPAQPIGPVLRGQALELVDQRGKLRSRLSVEPGGEVVLRLLDAKGTIRVKLGAGEDGSGLVLLDEATEPAIHLIARRAGTAARPATTSLTLRADNQTRIIRP
jgi:hypothetical protein